MTVGAAATHDRLGSFRATAAETWFDNGVILVRLTSQPKRYGELVAVIKTVTEVVKPAVDDIRLRALLTEVHAIEQGSAYRLIRDEEDWAWCAVLTVR